MKNGVCLYALDISAVKIAAVASVINRKGEIIDTRCQLGSMRGIKNGAIQDLGLVSESISKTLDNLKVSASKKVKSLYVVMQGENIKAINSAGIIPISERANKIITSADVSKANHQAYSLGLSLEESVLHQIPQGYVIDNQNRVLDPRGLYGHKLEADLLLIVALCRDVENLASAVDRAGCRVKAIILSGLATALAVVPEEAKIRGCYLLDIGFDSTQLLLFKDGILRAFELFRYGSNHITEAIAGQLNLPYELAEEIKLSYGATSMCNINPEAEVLVKKDASYRPIKRMLICSIIEKQLQEMFFGIKERILARNKNLDCQEGIIVSGKTALMEGFLEWLEKNFGLPVRLANIENAPISDLSYATAIGLIKYAISQRPQIHPLKLSSYGNIFQKIVSKSKEIYQEYF